MIRGSYIQVDETPIRYLDPGNGKTGLGYLWVAHRPGEDVLFKWYTTREAKCLDKLVPINFSGTIQCDGYSAYDRFAKDRTAEGKAVLLAGWALARRGFYEAVDHAPSEARGLFGRASKHSPRYFVGHSVRQCQSHSYETEESASGSGESCPAECRPRDRGGAMVNRISAGFHPRAF
jgi:hypothetical protein